MAMSNGLPPSCSAPRNPFAGVRSGKIIDAGADGVHRGLRKHLGDRALEDVGAVAPEIVGDVLRSHADREIGLQAEQESERLDAAGNVDRLAVAIGEVDLLVHDNAAACAKRSKAARGSDEIVLGKFVSMTFQNGEIFRPERPARAMAEKGGIAGNQRIAALLHRPQQIGRAETRAFQHIQRAEHCGAIGQLGRIQPAGPAAEAGRGRSGSRQSARDRPSPAACPGRRRVPATPRAATAPQR